MKKALILLSLCLLCGLPLRAGGFHAGAGWGASMNVVRDYHFNYLEETFGYRIDEDGAEVFDAFNAWFEGFISQDIGKKNALSLRIGWAGIAKGRKVLPIMLQWDRHFAGNYNDGWFVFAGAGAVLGHMTGTNHSWIAREGAGYRICLGGGDCLDITASFRSVLDRPRIFDSEEGRYVSGRNTLRNNVWYHALTVGISLSF
ncbi:MAG: hypothetical protein J5771_04540 [Bacteroidales bacterium]|nr:hypothetical protein [Bacteroidales bacterium]